MKKLTLSFTVVALALIPFLLFAQPPRKHSGPIPHAQPVVVQPAARPTLQVHAPAPQAIARGGSSIAHHSVYRPTVVQPRVVVMPQVFAPAVVATPIVTPTVVTPYYPGYYYPSGSGFSLTIGGRSGVFSISSGY